ncbi:class I SAM-dependent methyltransferase [Phytohabitans flavus]|uniref:S-adenosyl-L-methionine-dependent methyltransferase n=1 Tax=Phytohabitans flavus TaxID=1076124 RepID=A0A6F8XS96_9ACTN|nr:class I SAM-dependent methyltransferase [Phytohabitans flavus]BCB76690.1 S-adenosyl-L-methionine-dependent methyltransferase [Phytohabitans flavus]
MPTGSASRTAVVMCQSRAAADGRSAVGRFADPVAAHLLSDDERVPVDQVRAGQRPQGWATRVAFESVRATMQMIVPRTVAIDDAVRDQAAPQVVVLGAGLDSRAWRMAELAGVDVFEVDRPPSQADKRARVGGLSAVARSVRFVAVDFAAPGDVGLADALAEAGHQAGMATTWIWEGVIPYLSPTAVAATLDAISVRSAAGSRLIASYQATSVRTRIGWVTSRSWGEPWRSLWRPEQLEGLLHRYGLDVVTDESLLTVAEQIGTSVQNRRSLRDSRVVVAGRPGRRQPVPSDPQQDLP